jgi:hypothetical protein
VLLTTGAFESSKVTNELRVISDGAEAIEHLRAQADAGRSPTSCSSTSTCRR